MSWWSRLLRKPVQPTRIIVIGHDHADAVRACRWLDVSPRSAKSAPMFIRNMWGFSHETVFYVTEYAASSLDFELKHRLHLHTELGGTVVWMEPYG